MTDTITWTALPAGPEELAGDTCTILPSNGGTEIRPGRADRSVADILVAGGATPFGITYLDLTGRTAESWAELLLTVFNKVDRETPDGVTTAVRGQVRYLDRLAILTQALSIDRTRVLDGVGIAGSILVPSPEGARFIPVSVALPGKAASTRHGHLLFKSSDSKGAPTLLTFNAGIGRFGTVMPLASPRGILVLAAFSAWLRPGMNPIVDGEGGNPAPKTRRPRTVWLETRMAGVLGETVPVVECTDTFYDPGAVAGMEGKMLRSVASALYDMPPGNGHRCAVVDPRLAGAAFREMATGILGTLVGDPRSANRLAGTVFGPRDAPAQPAEYWDDD